MKHSLQIRSNLYWDRVVCQLEETCKGPLQGCTYTGIGIGIGAFTHGMGTV